MFKFKLNTASKDSGPVKGWNVVSDFDRTLESVISNNDAEEKEALKVAIVKALDGAKAKEAEYYGKLSSPRCARGTKFGDRIAAGYTRAISKVSKLERGLATLN